MVQEGEGRHIGGRGEEQRPAGRTLSYPDLARPPWEVEQLCPHQAIAWRHCH